MNELLYEVAITSNKGTLVFEAIIRDGRTVEVRDATLPPICSAQVLTMVVRACIYAHARDNYADDGLMNSAYDLLQGLADDKLMKSAYDLLQDLSYEHRIFHEGNSFRTKDGSDA